MFNPARTGMLLCVVGGAALPLAFEPFGWFWLAPVCYAALIFAWRAAAPGRAFRLGFVFGCAGFLAGIHWIYISVHEFGQAPAALAIALTVGLVVAMALYSGAVGWVAARWLGTDGAAAWLVVLPALWVLAEWWRGWFLTGFGWLAAGYTQSDSWLMAYAPILGLYGVSWAVLVVAGALVALAAGAGRARVAAALTLAAVLGAALLLRDRAWTEPKAETLTTALVQGSVPQDLKWLPEQLPVTLELYRNLTREVHGSELIVWPEAAIPDLYENRTAYLRDIERRAAEAGSTVMLGMLRYHRPTGTVQNAVYTLGAPGSVYVKRHLVPYGEYFPVPEFVRSWLRSMQLPNIDTQRGEPEQPPLEVLGERIAVTICYEDVFGAEQLHSLPAASLLVNVSNDAWFGESIAAGQHLQIARFRAAEAGRYLLRATNTGITAVIDPAGRVVDALPQFERGALRAEVRGYTGATPYVRWGNYAVVLLALAALAAQLATTKLTMRPGT